MATYASFVGNIIYIGEAKNSTPQKKILNVKVSCKTGQRKAEGQQYAPSIIADLTFWEAKAASMEKLLKKGMTVSISGQVNELLPYESANGLACNIQFPYPILEIVNWNEDGNSSESESTVEETKPKETKKTTKNKKAVDEFFGDDELDDDLFEDL